ncbi:hypothetical protein ACJMK2_013045 [Sinanodonta woodiana]|uniref:X-box-binding protein 1 n=1 Tax=Sinanodonta woodiana TaxID=1069815 RepID=A0ABD3VA39_SINWO
MSLTTAKTIVITTLPNKSIISAARIPSLSIMEDDLQEDDQPRKRRRLTNLTQEEKLMRRKLKNRVAAQTARDRKKALMADLEEKIAELEAENRKLSMENATLKSQSGALVQENSDLRGRLSLLDGVPVKVESESRSAVPTVPQQKGQTSPLPCWTPHHITSWVIMSLTLWLASSKRSASQKTNNVPESFPVKRNLDTFSNLHPREQWWGPHQQSWNPSMN